MNSIRPSSLWKPAARGAPYIEARAIALKTAMIPITNPLFAVGVVSAGGFLTLLKPHLGSFSKRHDYNLAPRRRRAFEITETEDKLIAAAAIMGDSKRPKAGYRTPAAIGTPRVL